MSILMTIFKIIYQVQRCFTLSNNDNYSKSFSNLPLANTRRHSVSWRWGYGWSFCNNIGPISLEVQVHNTERTPATFLHALGLNFFQEMSMYNVRKFIFNCEWFLFKVLVSIWITHIKSSVSTFFIVVSCRKM